MSISEITTNFSWFSTP